MPLVVLLCGALVLYPIGFLINELLNDGDPSTFPPEEGRPRQLHQPDL